MNNGTGNPRAERDEDPLAMSRAEEILYVNERPATPPEPACRPTDQPAGEPAAAPPEAVAAGRAPVAGRLARGLSLLALLALLAAIVATFWDVSLELVHSTVQPWIAESLGVEADALGLPARPPRAVMMLVVQSSPDGATVSVDGVERGTTPAVLDVECTTPTVRVVLERPGFARWTGETPCVAGTDERLLGRLRRAPR